MRSTLPYDFTSCSRSGSIRSHTNTKLMVRDSMQAMRALLDPKAIAVVGASQKPGRGTSVVANLRDAGFGGGIVAINSNYTDVLGFPCYPSVNELPANVDCLVIAIPA